MMITEKKIKGSEFLKLTGVRGSLFVLSSLPFTTKLEIDGAKQEFTLVIVADSYVFTLFSTTK